MALSPLSRRAALALALTAGLAACGTGGQDPLVTALRAVTGGIAPDGTAADAGPALTAATLPPALLAGVDGPLILVEATRLGGATLMTQVGRNGPDTTWRGPEGWGLTLGAQGLLRSTRGLGFDLMATDVAPAAAALAAGRDGAADRLMVHLDGEGRARPVVHACTLGRGGPDSVTIAGTPRPLVRVTETCRFDGETYENIYWRDGAGRTVQSVQWVGPEIGHLRITALAE